MRDRFDLPHPPPHDDSVKMAFKAILGRLLSRSWDEVCKKVVFIAPPLVMDQELDRRRDEGSYLIFMLEGSQRTLYSDHEGRKEYVHRPGEVLYLASGISYTNCRDTAFQRLGIGAYKRRYRLSYDFHMATEKPPVPDLWHCKSTSDSSGYFKMFSALDDRARLGESTDIVNRMLPRLLLLALREMLTDSPLETAGSRSECQFRRIVDYVDMNFALPISRKTVSEHLQLSESYISRLFHENSGQSLSEYLKTVRMKHAYQMISTGKLTVEKTAAACGFTDASYFSRVFQEYWELRPGRLRSKHGEEQS